MRPPPISGSTGKSPARSGERSEQGVAGPEHCTRADDGRARKRLLDHPFAASACADVRRSGLGIGADAGNEHEAGDTDSGRLPR